MEELPESIADTIRDLDERAVVNRMNRLDEYLSTGVDDLTREERDDFYHLQGQIEGMRYTIGMLSDAMHDSLG